jgi:oligoribonuclease NrnB/cAMP/cGMP phosphodiesterase (DHH superfamily)
MKVFYHNDMDGKASAAIFNKCFHESRFIQEELFPDADTLSVEYIEIDYKDRFPAERIQNNEPVIILDFTPKIYNFTSLFLITESILWIDHHLNAVELEKEYQQVKNVLGLRNTGIAACELTWQYFFSKLPNQIEVPRAIKLLGDYDTHRFLFGEETILFQLGIQLGDCSPTSIVWSDLLNIHQSASYAVIRNITSRGEVAQQYRKNQYEKAVTNWSHEATFEGFNCIACNSHEGRSSLFDSLPNKNDYDLMIVYQHDGEKWTVKMFTEKDNVDVYEIAKKYHGGGHKKAAGFVCNVLPFGPKLKKIDSSMLELLTDVKIGDDVRITETLLTEKKEKACE